MLPILGRYGPFFLYSYTVVLGLGILAGLGLIAIRARTQPAAPAWPDAALVAMLAGLVGGRLGYVAANWSYFAVHRDEIGLVWHGGLSYHGALLAGAAALWLWARWRRASFSAYAGLFAPALALGSAFGWAACWLAGCAYGRETVVGLLAADLPDHFGVFALRYQTQLLGVAASLSVFALAVWFQRRRPSRPGRLFWLTLLALSGGRLLVGLLRGDTMLTAAGWPLDVTLDVTLDGLLILAAVAALTIRRTHHES